MNKKFIIGTLIGTVVAFFSGWLVYGIMLSDFFESNSPLLQEIKDGLYRPEEEMVWSSLILFNVALGALLSYVAGIGSMNNFMSAAKMGLIVGFLIGAWYNFSMHAFTFSVSTNALIADLVVGSVLAAITAGVIGWYRAR